MTKPEIPGELDRLRAETIQNAMRWHAGGRVVSYFIANKIAIAIREADAAAGLPDPLKETSHD